MNYKQLFHVQKWCWIWKSNFLIYSLKVQMLHTNRVIFLVSSLGTLYLFCCKVFCHQCSINFGNFDSLYFILLWSCDKFNNSVCSMCIQTSVNIMYYCAQNSSQLNTRYMYVTCIQKLTHEKLLCHKKVHHACSSLRWKTYLCTLAWPGMGT